MNPIIPEQRKFKTGGRSSFNDLVAYLEGEKEQGKERQPLNEKQLELPMQFRDLLDYATSPLDKVEEKKCIAIRTHGIHDLTCAAFEMDYVASKNTRCKDPAYHVILSWPEHERPKPEDMFDAAEHAIKALGLAEHQYVLAIHDDTDNIHCHISVNRIHPVTYKARHIEWAVKNLQMAARQSEIKHGWSHDNGIYIVEIDGKGKKQIVLNPDHAAAVTRKHAHSGVGKSADEKILPAWHDPDTLDSWLKTTVAKQLKHALPQLDGWPALHAWLDKANIQLTDSGGGGMRLHAASQESGEIIDIAASKVLRVLKRTELEKRWGPFTNSQIVECLTPDLSNLTQTQINKGIEHVLGNHRANKPPDAILARTPDIGRPPQHIIRAEQHTNRDATEEDSGMHELPTGRVDAQGQGRRVLLQDTVHGGLGDNKTGQDNDVRRAGTGTTSSTRERVLKRDPVKRQERKEQRALARIDLQQRFQRYKRFVGSGDTAYFLKTKEIQKERIEKIKEISAQSKAAKAAIPKATATAERFLINIEINAEVLRRKLLATAQFQEQSRAIRITRIPPLSWRAWLYEQSNLGDKAALSALRGIVYQAQRDAKKKEKVDDEEIEEGAENYSELQYKRTMARLLEEEKKEAAIRSANHYSMRPYEADALLASYQGIQWRVTGNGNVEYSAMEGNHLFTDRGNRVTFDKVRVTDDEIRLALVHAEQKFRGKLTLTGEDQAFTERMARLADDMGITVLNPELAVVIERHRETRLLEITQAITINPADIKLEITPANLASQAAPEPAQQPNTRATQYPAPRPSNASSAQPKTPRKATETPEPIQHPEAEQKQPQAPAIIKTPNERLRESVLAIDPRATFVVVDPLNSPYPHFGPVAAVLESEGAGFAQHTGRSIYALHPIAAPKGHHEAVIEISYDKKGTPAIKIPDPEKGQGV